MPGLVKKDRIEVGVRTNVPGRSRVEELVTPQGAAGREVSEARPGAARVSAQANISKATVALRAARCAAGSAAVRHEMEVQRCDRSPGLQGAGEFGLPGGGGGNRVERGEQVTGLT